MAERGSDNSDWLVNIRGFNESLFDEARSGYLPPVARRPNPTTTIYLVPGILSRSDPKAYIPQIWFLRIEGKLKYLFGLDGGGTVRNTHAMFHVQSILDRNKRRRFEDYLKAMHEVRDRIVECHLNGSEMDFKRLLQAVFSSCIVVDILLRFHDGELTTSVDEHCATWLQHLWVDLLLVQNQIPFFLLQLVYNMAAADDHYPPLVYLCLHFFSCFLEPIMLHRPSIDSESVHHLLHLIHHSLLPPSRNPPKQHSSTFGKKFLQPIWTKLIKKLFLRHHPAPSTSISLGINPKKKLTMKPIPSAKRLQDAGIKFRKKEEFCIISFNKRKGLLEIPYLHVDNNTRKLLLNLVAWEHCHGETFRYFTGYVIFMDYLVNSAQDVEILLQSGIMEQSLGSNEKVAEIFNGLMNPNLVYGEDDGHLPALFREINEYCRNDYNIWWAKLMTNYFSSPWTVVSVVAAFILLLLTLAQTFFSVFSYFIPP